MIIDKRINSESKLNTVYKDSNGVLIEVNPNYYKEQGPVIIFKDGEIDSIVISALEAIEYTKKLEGYR